MLLIKLLPVSKMMTQKNRKKKFHYEHFTKHQTFPEHSSPTHKNEGKRSLIKVNNCFPRTQDFNGFQKVYTNPVFSYLYMHFLCPAMSWVSSAATTFGKTMEEGRVNISQKYIQSWSLSSPVDFFWLKKKHVKAVHVCSRAHTLQHQFQMDGL